MIMKKTSDSHLIQMNTDEQNGEFPRKFRVVF